MEKERLEQLLTVQLDNLKRSLSKEFTNTYWDKSFTAEETESKTNDIKANLDMVNNAIELLDYLVGRKK